MKQRTDQLLLTFVVPCYNVEKYIQRCLDSIFACGLSEDQFEIICVNDCSPDGTNEILEQNRLEHSNLHIIKHEVNKGLGGSRNTGIRMAKGCYLWFVDSDDEIFGDGFAEAIKKAVLENLDVLCFNYCRIDEGGMVLSRHKVFETMPVTDGYSFVKRVFGDSIVNHMGYVVRFLYRTEFLRTNELLFPEQVHWEDTVFMPKSLLLAEGVASVSQVFYAYRVNPNSISGVFGRAYPAKSIYELAFCAGADLLRFSEEVKDESLRLAFKNSAVNKYINGFPIHLFRTNKEERRRFYEILKMRKEEVNSLKPNLTLLNKMLLVPCFGPLVTGLLSAGYKKKHQ